MSLESTTLKTLAAGIIVLSLSGPGRAQNQLQDQLQDQLPDSAGGRYIFSKQGNGFVRLDSKTGEVALCSPKSVGLACEAAPEDRTVLENEIARLRSENAILKKDLIARGLPLPPGASAEPPPAQGEAPVVRLPSDAEIDRMVALAGRVWHRLIDALERAQRQILNKS